MTREPPTARTRWLGALVLLAALAARLLFWSATPDRKWPHSAFFKGDAIVWSDYAAALSEDRDFELGLPLRPPANAYLLAALGVDGRDDAWRAKPIWCFLGALTVLLFFRAALAGFGLPVALVVAAWCSFSTAMLVLATSLNNETPYLLLVAALVLVLQRLENRRSNAAALIWGAVNALACLFRVEHLIFFLLGSAWIWLLPRPKTSSRARSARDSAKTSTASRRRRSKATERPKQPARPRFAPAWALAAFFLVLLPWHLSAWKAVADFNALDMQLDRAGEAAQRSVERATRAIRWTPEAEAARAELPGFARRSAASFVSATVLVRGGRVVEADDLEILDEAFGTRPRPLAARPFVALYGPLNFYLANREGAPPGFDVGGLDRPPPLDGGRARYPRALLGGLPPPDLNFFYPPHVELVTDGYRLGWESIRDNPGDFARRVVRRLVILWQGASQGWTGFGLPWGIEGVRRAVDLAVPEGSAILATWRWALLIACAAGLWLGRRSSRLVPWLALVATKLVATVLFFGYARHGAALVPIVALLCGVALSRLARLEAAPTRRLLLAAGLVAAIALGVECVRWAKPPPLSLDEAPIEGGDPHPLLDHRDRGLAAG